MRLHYAFLLALIATPAAALVVPPPSVDASGDPIAEVSAVGLSPIPPGSTGPVVTVRGQGPNGAVETTVDAGKVSVVHFGPGLAQMFVGEAQAHGFGQANVGFVRLFASASASSGPLAYEAPFPGALGVNQYESYANISMLGVFWDVVVPPPTTGKPSGPTSLVLEPHFDCSIGEDAGTIVAFGVGTGLYTDPDNGIGTVAFDTAAGCGASLSRAVGGLTVGTPVLVRVGVALTTVARAGNDLLPPHDFQVVQSATAFIDGLGTGYTIIKDLDGNPVVGQSGFNYGAKPVLDPITTTTSTTTTTTFVPPTTLPGCDPSVYCGDGVRQAECGEACDCPKLDADHVTTICTGDVAIPALGSACKICTGCQVDDSACTTTTTSSTTTTNPSITTTTTMKTTTTTTTTAAVVTTTTQPKVVTTTTQPRRVEACGDCVDNDGNGLVDREDPACCAPAALALVLKKSRLVPGGASSLDLALPGAAAKLADLARGSVTLQVRAAAGPELLCLRLPALVRKGKLYAFHAKGSVPGAGGITGATLRASHGDALLHLEGKKLALAHPEQTTLLVTVGFADASVGSCGSTSRTLRRQGKSGLKFP